MTEKKANTEKKLNIEKIIEQAISRAVNTSVILGVEKGKKEAKNLFKQTELRLYAYPELQGNIEKYNRDIQDLRQETPGRSKDIVFFSMHGGGTRLSADEIQEARIMILQKKIYRDQTEIDEIDYALQAVRNDDYYPIIEMKYFKGKNDDEIALEVSCDPSTVRRNKSRLVRKIEIKLYGAEVVS
jgi:DNA repair exonuclease SbcCD ATPase subunit